MPSCWQLAHAPLAHPQQAYVRFASPGDARRAVGRDCAIFSQRFGQRYVHVYAVTAADLADLQATTREAADALTTQQA